MSGARSSGFRLGGTSLAAALCLLLVAGLASASGGDPGGGGPFTPGAAGAGDPYFPLDGNGGYDAQHYELDLRYNPATDTIGGTARIEIRATQNLSRFNLDLEGLTVHAIEVDRRPAAWTREGGELVITPQRGIRDRQKVAVEIDYSGVPETIVDLFGTSGFIHTDDGAVIIGQPHVADTWYPVNDHPIDKASYRFDITVPDGLEVVATGELRGTRRWPRT
jgi:aminopeptidase N